jgi:hypothetical protein
MRPPATTLSFAWATQSRLPTIKFVLGHPFNYRRQTEAPTLERTGNYERVNGGYQVIPRPRLTTVARAFQQTARHRRLAVTGLAAGGVLLAAVTSVGSATGAASSRADEVTVSQDNLRTNWDPDEPTLSPANVSGQTHGYTFGQVFDTAVTGQVYAQPLVVGSTIIVATEADYVYGLNAATGAVKWTTQVGTPYAITSCGDLSPDVGVTGTPVYDPATGDVYLVAQVMMGSDPAYEMLGLSARTGVIAFRKTISGTASNDPDITFNATNELARPGLLLMNGWVYAAFGSHCDHSPYVGFVDGVRISTGRLTQWSDETGVTDNQAGIWQSGGGLMSDGPGRIFVTSGNGISPPAGPGTSPPGQLAESVTGCRCGATAPWWRRTSSARLMRPRWTPGTSTLAPADRSHCRLAPAVIRTCWPRPARTAGSFCWTATTWAVASKAAARPTGP